MAATPIYIGTWRTEVAKISTANTAINGTGTIADIFTFGSSGGILECVNIKAEVTTTAGMIRIWEKKSSTYYLIYEVPVAAITPSATVRSFLDTVWFNRHYGNGDIIACSTEKAESFSIQIIGGDY